MCTETVFVDDAAFFDRIRLASPQSCTYRNDYVGEKPCTCSKPVRDRRVGVKFVRLPAERRLLCGFSNRTRKFRIIDQPWAEYSTTAEIRQMKEISSGALSMLRASAFWRSHGILLSALLLALSLFLCYTARVQRTHAKAQTRQLDRLCGLLA